MKIINIWIFISLLGINSCKQKVVNENTKPDEINQFKKEFKSLADSANELLVGVIYDLENGKDTDSNYDKIKRKMRDMEQRIDKKSRSFQEVAIKLKLTKEENLAIFKELDQYIHPLMLKYQKIEKLGVKFQE